MTLEKAHELVTITMVSGYVMRGFSQETVDALIREYDLEKQWKIKPDTEFESAFKS